MSGSLIDLLGAMGDYFDARAKHNAAMDAHHDSGGYSWDYYGASYIADLENAYARVERAWRDLVPQVTV